MTGENPRNPRADMLFASRYKGKPNVMTPRIWSRRLLATGQLAVELSSGDGIGHERSGGDTLWGVTVLIVRDIWARHSLSSSFPTRAEAEAYIERLRGWRGLHEAL